MRTSTVIVLALLTMAPLAGCAEPASAPAAAVPPALDAGAAPPVRILVDAAGDAFETNWDQARWAVPCVSAPASPAPVPLPCWPNAPHPALGSAGGTPAPPARDLLGVEVQETATTLEVRMEIAGLDESLDGAVDAGSGEGTSYIVEIYNDGKCSARVWQLLWQMSDEVEHMRLFFWTCDGADDPTPRDTPCGYSECAWGIPGAIEYGAPAVLSWSVPRSLLAQAPAAEGFGAPHAFILTIAQPYGASPDHSATYVRGPVQMTFFPPATVWYLVDASEAGEPLAFTRPHPPAAHGTFPVRVTGDGLARASQPTRPDARLLDYRVEELPDRLRLTATLATVDETPADHGLELVLTVPGHFVSAGYRAVDGERHAFATLYAADDSSVGLPITLQVTPGAPGAVVAEIARADLPRLTEGSLASWTYAGTSDASRNATEAGAIGIHSDHWRALDFICCGPPVVFGAAGAALDDPGVHRLNGASGDARLPPDAVSTSRARFDLQTLEVASTVPGEVRFTLGLADLSALDPPDAYDAVFYAVGVEHDGGRTMVGYYRGQDRPLGEFLCATDATVLVDEPMDPVRSPDWLEVQGRVLVATESASLSQGSGRAAAGSAAFVIGAPIACFGLDDDAEELNVTQLGAGSYLVRRTTQRLPESEVARTVTRVDSLPPAERPFLLALAQPIVPEPSFWEAPFGLANGWDVLGAILAILTVAITLALFVRRRRLMRWYVDEIARIDRTYLADPISRAKALVALRRRLHRDILRHRVSDAEYIRDRLRSSLTSARLVTVSDGFYGLPAPLAMRLERMLDDGRMTAEESKLIEPLVERAPIPPEARSLLVERLRAWVEEDSHTA